MNNFQIIFSVLVMLVSFSCLQKPVSLGPDWSEKLDSLYVWDIQSEIKGAIMFLDVAYQKCDSCVTDFLTLSLAKQKCRSRPDWIAVILPDNIIQDEGVFLFFEEKENSESKISKCPIRVNLDEHTNDTFAVRFKDGFAMDENNQKVDILQKFLETERVFFMIFYMNGEHKTIALPLKFFKKQFNELE